MYWSFSLIGSVALSARGRPDRQPRAQRCCWET